MPFIDVNKTKQQNPSQDVASEDKNKSEIQIGHPVPQKQSVQGDTKRAGNTTPKETEQVEEIKKGFVKVSPSKPTNQQSAEDISRNLEKKLSQAKEEVQKGLLEKKGKGSDLANIGTENVATNSDNILQKAQSEIASVAAQPQLSPNTEKRPSMEADIQKLEGNTVSFQDVLKEALQTGASDVHFAVGYRAKIRVDGDLKTLSTQEFSSEETKQFAKIITAERDDISLKDLRQVDLTYTFENRRFRVNIFSQRGELSISMRIIPKNIKSIEELSLPQVVKDFSKFANGLVLVTGPTGSGKSTTIASLLNMINLNRPKHIITLEDPIEYIYPKGQCLIDQRESGLDFESWPDALRSVLRQDPDIVLVGEMRDIATIESALQVAETGHLVFATLHTNSASETINRIIDVFPTGNQDQIRTLLSSVIRAVVSQKLVPIQGGGRRPAVEIMIANSAIKNSIRDKKVFQIDNSIQTGQEEGMISLEASLVRMVRDGLITIEEAKEHTTKPAEIDILMRKS